ncbi:MAG: bifunctional diaminohydroxyphosphoribosylaminopyrimidine deaminase/5-amino-6-(5-phosphoribosylamino)uracil reductase RibD [Bacteroidaceae bacterium]|nr:bifunctional diaminohydroxyphosphoribosylaminopyrimidine deaminase/5-amino-6-(5-phosphoribosylamino)uracil reductase RibD [Bacteroidaceae bacterium]
MTNEQEKVDEMYMRRCIQLAQNGIAGARPNPMVGAVVVCDGRIIGEGYHCKCGGPHAEVNAIASVREPKLLERSTIYCSLEPCAHYGKTPPCADLIVSKRIPRVVIGCQDPFAKVDGLGIRKLRDAGCEVKVGVLEAECLALNRRFITRHTHQRPYIVLKWAQSDDGFMGQRGERVVFSSPTTQALVHKLRAEADAILVGARTAAEDNPSLTTRQWYGRNPIRCIIDLRGTLPAHLHVFDGSVPTRVYVGEGITPEYAANVTLVPTREEILLPTIMADLIGENVQSLLVEGGAATLQRFVAADLWDEARIETAPFALGEGVPAPHLTKAPTDEQVIDGRRIVWVEK